ncbi:MAG: ATP-binding protein [Haloarculaceae archaeon]
MVDAISLLLTSLLVLVGIAFAAVAARSYAGDRRTVVRWFAATAALLAVAAVGASVDSFHGGRADMLRWGVYPLAVLIVPIVWARFVFEYYGLIDFTSRRRTAALLAPAIVASVLGIWVGWAMPTLVGEAGRTVTGPARLVLPVAYTLYVLGHNYATGVVIIALGLLFHTMSGREDLNWRLGASLAGFAVVPWLGNLTLGLFRVAGIGASPAVTGGIRTGGFLVGAAAAVLVCARYEPFERLPAAGTLGPETVLRELDDMVIVVDDSDRVARLNEAARRAFAPDGSVVGEPAASVIGTAATDLNHHDQVRLPTVNGPCQFDPSVSALDNEHGETVGRTVVLRDVTERRARRQRLTVLNRALRHNLRNEVSVVLARAEMIAVETDGEPAEMAESVAAKAHDIAAIGEKARRIERMMAVPATDDAEADVSAAVRRVVGEVEADRDCAVDRSIPDGVVAGVPDRILRTVLEDVVENAVVHNDTASPSVAVSVRVDESAALPVAVAVADDGPGIPPEERRPVVSGDEAPLEHGSGLGLWGVKWGVARMGGELEFADNDPRGTVVRLRLPGASGD